MTASIDMLEAIGATYGVLSRAFDYPDEDLWSRLEGRALGELIGELEGDNGEGLDTDYVFPVRSQEERAGVYLRLFELGKMHLYEGGFRPQDGREGIQEELFRFYHFFDLKLGESNRDYPDHIVTELEFLMYLADLEAAAIADGRDPVPIRLAQKDFLDRHVLVWAPELKRRQLEADGGAYAVLASWLDAFARRHRDILEAALTPADISAGPTDTSHEVAT